MLPFWLYLIWSPGLIPSPEAVSAGIMILPFILLKPLSENYGLYFRRFSWTILLFGPLMLILFSIAKIGDNPHNFIVALKGLWQRLLMLNYYAYIIFLAYITWQEIGKTSVS